MFAGSAQHKNKEGPSQTGWAESERTAGVGGGADAGLEGPCEVSVAHALDEMDCGGPKPTGVGGAYTVHVGGAKQVLEACSECG